MQNNNSGIRKLYVNTAGLIIIIFLFLCLVPSTSSALIYVKEGDAPKEIILNDLQNSTVNVSDFYGKKPVIIVFWEQRLSNAFLDYSMDALKFLSDYYEQYHDETGLEVFGIYTPEEDGVIPNAEIAKVKNLIKINNIKFPILIDLGYKVFQEYGVIALPTTVMVSKAGKVQFIYPSFPMAARSQIAERAKILMGLAVPAKKEKVMKGPNSKSGRFYRYALQMYKKGLSEQALSPLKKSIELDPDQAMSHNLLGITLWESGKSDEAHDAFRRAIELDKSNIATHLNYSVLLFEQEQYADVERKLKSLDVTDAQFKVRIHYMLGLIYRNTDRIDEAIMELEEAINIIEKIESEDMLSVSFSDSYRVFLLRDLADLFDKKNNKDKTIELLTKAVRVSLDLDGKSDPRHLQDRKGIMLYE